MDNIEKPANCGKRWSSEELSILLSELKKKKDITQIAIDHKRTENAIIARCGEIAYKMYLEEKPMKKIIKKTRLTKEEIKEILEKKSTKKNTKENTLDEYKLLREEINVLKDKIEKMENIISKFNKL